MFLCRRLLPRVRILKLDAHYSLLRRTLQNVSLPDSALDASAKPDGNQSHGSPSTQLIGTRCNKLSVHDVFPLLCSAGQGAKESKSEKSGVSLAPLYLELRRCDLGSVANLPARSYLCILNEACRSNSHDLVDVICRDIIDAFRGNDRERQQLLESVILIADISRLSIDTFLSTLDSLGRLSESIDVRVIDRITRFVVAYEDESFCEPVIHLLHPMLLKLLRQYQVPAGAYSLTYYPPSLVYSAFTLIHKLLASRKNQPALDLLHTLVDNGLIPREVIRSNVSNSNDLYTVVTATLVRASLHWNWRPLAARLLSRLLHSADSFDESLFELAVDASYAILDTPTAKDVRACASLLLEIHKFAPIPSGLVRHFYSSAAECMLGDEAAAFYQFSRMPSIVQQHRYPPPQGVALWWLMQHLSTVGRKTYLSRALAREVVEDNLPILPQYRARFISLAATQGYSSLARRLWDRYSVGRDRHLVVGNSALMLRMTSLFSHLIRRMKLGADTGVAAESLRSQLHDLITFQNHVLLAYCKYHEPLTEAPHSVVTSFARASFIVGNFAEGFDSFKILLDRREIPDMYDVNVALTAIAEHQPRAAASIIEGIKQKGIQPDAVGYATVLHFAQRHNDSELVAKMIDCIRGLEGGQLTLKSVAALIRATVASNGDEGKESQRLKLQDAMNIVRHLTKKNFPASPQIGKYLVFTALRADCPTMAYQFWYRLLRESAEWDDAEQMIQRRLISRMIRKHWRRRWLKDYQVYRMLKRLETRPRPVSTAQVVGR
ncbi:hypothetical protein AX17_005248 [Amanita inopinata Kibby_2008]|nr:hypothetical protein AX17_005248 [Amanita inopinata Kibby_2008]